MRTEDSSSEFITVETAAQLAGLSHWTIRRWLAQRGGKLTRYKSASRTVVSRAELLERVRPTPVQIDQKTGGTNA
jgi:hypothetical protein